MKFLEWKISLLGYRFVEHSSHFIQEWEDRPAALIVMLVHKAKKKQLVKRNAIQALMLTTSLIDYICVRTKREQLDRLSGRINNPLHSS